METQHSLQSRRRWWDFSLFAVAFVLLVAAPRAGRAETHGQVIDRLLNAIEAQTDTAFVERGNIYSGLRDDLVFPQRLRKLVTEWEGSKLSRVGRVDYVFDDGGATVIWHTSFYPDGKEEAVRARFAERMREFGFDEARDGFARPVQENYDRLKARRDSVAQYAKGYRRDVGNIVEEVVVSGLEGGLIGGRYDVEIDFCWAASTKTELPRPTFVQLRDACPLMQVRESEDAIDAVLAGETLRRFEMNYHPKPQYCRWSVTVPIAARAKLESSLKRLDFKPSRTSDLTTQASTVRAIQYSWQRSSDATFAHVIPVISLGVVRFVYQPPHRRPKALRPVSIDELVFARHPLDGEELRTWERLARQVVTPECQHTPWHVYERLHSTDYRTFWQRQDGDGTNARTLQKIELKADPWSREPQKISSVSLSAIWRPDAEGWGASVGCSTSAPSRTETPDRPGKRWSIYFHHFTTDDLDPRFGSYTLGFLPGLAHFYEVKRFGGTTYNLRVVVEPAESRDITNAELKAWIKSPESMRDVGLKWLDQLGAEVERQVRSGEAVQRAYRPISDTDQARRDEPAGLQLFTPRAKYCLAGLAWPSLVLAVPPEPEPPAFEPSDRELTEAEQQLVIREAKEDFEQRRNQLRQNYREMHAALLKAFPFDEYLRRD